MTFYKKQLPFIVFMLFVANSSMLAQLQNVREKVFIDVNASDLIVGETLYYSTLCLSETTNKKSNLSKFLYVELIGEEGVVFQRKHQLTDGVAHGNFFIPSSMTTGQYYLVAYTRWMRNFNDISKTPLTFINPYKQYDNPVYIAKKAQVSFKTLSGELVSNHKNQVAFMVTAGNRKVARTGRLIGNEQKITDIESNANGLGYFEFTPEEGVNYQLLLEQPDGGFEFFDLPKAKANGVGLNITHSDEIIEALPIGAATGGSVVIKHQGITVFARQVQSSFPMRIERGELPRDVLTIAFMNVQGNEEFSAPLFNNSVVVNNNVITSNTRANATAEQSLPKGNYSISVRKSFSEQYTQQHAVFAKSQFDYISKASYNELQMAVMFQESNQQSFEPNRISLLPEYRYELLEGKIKAVSEQSPIAEQNVILSLTGEETINMSVAKTDNNGNFIMEYTTVNRGTPTPAHLSINDFEHEYDFEVKENFIEHDLTFTPVFIDTTLLESIRQRSIISQIDNAYFTPEIDSTGIENNVLPTIAAFNAHYEFDDYVRFRSLKQHFVEYIPFAGVRERKDSKNFVVYSVDDGVKFETAPLVLLDGVPVNGTDLLDYSPYRIKSVEILNRRLFFGSLIRDGVLSFQTIEGNLDGFDIATNHTSFELLTPEPNNTIKSFEPIEDARTPDTRVQLLWLPDYKVEESGLQQINFTTSDIEGTFELQIEGFAEDGTPISITRKIEVKALSNE